MILKFVSVIVLALYLASFAWLGTKELRKHSLQTQFVGVILNLPSRFHEPMNFYELEHFKATLTELVSGPGDFQGLEQAPALDSYLEDQGYDMPSVVALLEQGKLRNAQSKLVELTIRVKEAHNAKQTQLTLLFFAALLGCFIVASWVAYCFGKAKPAKRASDERSIDVDEMDAVSPLAAAIHNISQIESINSGHAHVLEIVGDELLSVTDEHYALLEASICEMVSNSIIHGGRASAVREAAGKPGNIKIFVGVECDEGGWAITVADDGEGIDEMSAMQHVLAKGLVSEEKLQNLEQGHGVKLILLDGFSDAQPNREGPLKSDSLAAIREAIKNAGGTMALRNRPTVFSEFKLHLPLSNAF